MPRPITFTFGPFVGGQNSQADPRTLADLQGMRETVGQRCVGADMSQGTLKGLYGPGTSVTTAATAGFCVHYHRGAGWIVLPGRTTNGYVNWACRDADDGAGNAISYVTQLQANGTVNVPRIYQGASNYPMGLVAPAAAPALTAGAGAAIAVAYTYVVEVSSVDVLESNPSARTASTASGGTATAVASADTRVTHIYYYRTKDADPLGMLYYLGKSTNAAATLNTAALVANTAVPLDWGVGGNVDDNLAVEDHSPAGQVTCFSEALHGGENELDGNQSGTLFYGIGSYWGWTHTGRLQYFPLRNLYRLPAILQASVSQGNQSLAFTELGTWSAVGVDDTVIQVNRTPARHHIRVGCGKTAVVTPFGVMYLAREGLALHDGLSSAILSANLVYYNDFLAYPYWWACFHDGFYYLSTDSVHADGYAITYAIDLRQGLAGLKVIRTRVRSYAFTVVPLLSGGPVAGMYVYDGSTGTIKPWRPLEVAGVAGAVQMDAEWETGWVGLGETTKRKDWGKWRANGSGPVTLKFYPDPDTKGIAVPAWSVTVTLPMTDHRKFPPAIAGRLLSAVLQVPAGSTLDSVELEGQLCG